MLVTLTNVESISLDLAVRRIVWSSSPARRFGEAELWVPRNSVAFSRTYLDDENGESFVELADAELGNWTGFVCRIVVDAAGAYVYCKAIEKWLDGRAVRPRIFEGYTAGSIFKSAVSDALAGLGTQALVHGAYLEAAPALGRYEFRSGQSVAQVAADLQEVTGHDWSISPLFFGSTKYQVNWLPPFGEHPLTGLWCGEGHLIDTSREVDAEERVTEVIGHTSDGQESRAHDGAGAGSGYWTRQVSVSVSSTSLAAAANAAQAELAVRALPHTVYRARIRRHAGVSVAFVVEGSGASRIPRGLGGAGVAGSIALTSGTALWPQIREGTILSTVLPHAGIGGSSPVLRVLTRAWTEGSPFLDVEFQYLRPFAVADALTVSTRRMAAAATPAHVPPLYTDPIRTLLKQQRQIQRIPVSA